ncbi:MAG: 2-oxo acid dehydrogenase subunit E2 [Alphaproteobacteria bacterium]|nr:2-oxo acid dehydrogenase subunit E2 [Alphaproteobacteria bacterium]
MTAVSRQFASPLARRLAAEKGLDLALVAGSGPHGRIVKADVLAAKPGAKPGAKAVAVIPAGGIEAIPNTTLRKTIARRLTESKQTIPHFYLSVDLDLDQLLDLREKLNQRAEGFKLSVNDFIIKASAKALRAIPAANASWTDEATLRYSDVDISVAVAAPGGLVTPIIRRADTKTLAQISLEMKALAEKARAGKLMPEDYQGGGFTISNLGMYGIKSFSAIINPPQACILAVGVGEKRPVVRDGTLAIATLCTVTLSVDHRAVDGVVGAELMAAFKKAIEDPLGLLL